MEVAEYDCNLDEETVKATKCQQIRNAELDIEETKKLNDTLIVIVDFLYTSAAHRVYGSTYQQWHSSENGRKVAQSRRASPTFYRHVKVELKYEYLDSKDAQSFFAEGQNEETSGHIIWLAPERQPVSQLEISLSKIATVFSAFPASIGLPARISQLSDSSSRRPQIIVAPCSSASQFEVLCDHAREYHIQPQI